VALASAAPILRRRSCLEAMIGAVLPADLEPCAAPVHIRLVTARGLRRVAPMWHGNADGPHATLPAWEDVGGDDGERRGDPRQ
jgi:hypothetical protein